MNALIVALPALAVVLGTWRALDVHDLYEWEVTRSRMHRDQLRTKAVADGVIRELQRRQYTASDAETLSLRAEAA